MVECDKYPEVLHTVMVLIESIINNCLMYVPVEPDAEEALVQKSFYFIRKIKWTTNL